MDLLWAFIQGSIVGSVAFGTISVCPRYLLSSEVGLVQLLVYARYYHGAHFVEDNDAVSDDTERSRSKVESRLGSLAGSGISAPRELEQPLAET